MVNQKYVGFGKKYGFILPLDFVFLMDGYNATVKIIELLVIFNKKNNKNILKLDVINFYVHIICGWELYVTV
jgi:hypothetical protein